MPYLIIIDRQNEQWEIIDHTYNNFPDADPVFYDASKTIDPISDAEDEGDVNIEHAVTGAAGTGQIVKIP